MDAFDEVERLSIVRNTDKTPGQAQNKEPDVAEAKQIAGQYHAIDLDSWLSNNHLEARSDFWKQDGMLGSPREKKKKEKKKDLFNKLKKLWLCKKDQRDGMIADHNTRLPLPPLPELIPPTPVNQHLLKAQSETNAKNHMGPGDQVIQKLLVDEDRTLECRSNERQKPSSPSIPASLHWLTGVPSPNLSGSSTQSEFSNSPRDSKHKESKLASDHSAEGLSLPGQSRLGRLIAKHHTSEPLTSERPLKKEVKPAQDAGASLSPDHQQARPPYNPADFPGPEPLPRNHTVQGFKNLAEQTVRRAEVEEAARRKRIEGHRASLLAVAAATIATKVAHTAAGGEESESIDRAKKKEFLSGQRRQDLREWDSEGYLDVG